jgi:glycyl-tRNA synthetase beta chain
MGKELLLEIGTEEIPAAFLPPAMRDMEDMIRKEFGELLIRHGDAKTMSTPRRLFLCVMDVAEKQEEKVIEKLGPAKRMAFDETGNPTPAALGFARSQVVDIESLKIVATDKGEYLASRKKITGVETKTLLPQILPKLISSISFRKSMRWADFELRFARPIHWVMAIYGGETIPFRIENIQSGNQSRGHRFLNPAAFEVKNLEEYLARTKEHFVIADVEERKRIILAQADQAAQAVSGTVFYTDELLETVACLVEYPVVICGSFDEAYLSLPREVLTTSMITHQKYFPLIDEKGNLLPHFLAVSNTLPHDPEVLKKGNEKVIRARLSDAQFFFEEDRKVSLDSRLNQLREVVFHNLLGTSYEKVMRFRTLAVEIASMIAPSLKERVYRTATLAKADLSTQMVGEFPDLQGIMGREYALLAGEDARVAKGIYEHYMPVTAGGILPETDEGAIVSIADKMDSIAGFFGVNLLPTGAADRYALRRQALGIINIILAKRYPIQLDKLIDMSLTGLNERLKRPPEEVRADILAFFHARFENQLISQGRPYDVVAAVLAAETTHVVKSVMKIEAMEDFKTAADFKPLAVAFKRVGNIIKDFQGGVITPTLFESKAETELYDAYLDIKEKAGVFIKCNDFPSALREMARLRLPVDKFFDSVLVMEENEKIRFNRLSLLWAISCLFREVADFSKLVTP